MRRKRISAERKRGRKNERLQKEGGGKKREGKEKKIMTTGKQKEGENQKNGGEGKKRKKENKNRLLESRRKRRS